MSHEVDQILISRLDEHVLSGSVRAEAEPEGAYGIKPSIDGSIIRSQRYASKVGCV